MAQPANSVSVSTATSWMYDTIFAKIQLSELCIISRRQVILLIVCAVRSKIYRAHHQMLVLCFINYYHKKVYRMYNDDEKLCARYLKEIHFQVTNPSVFLAQTSIPCSLTQVYDTTS